MSFSYSSRAWTTISNNAGTGTSIIIPSGSLGSDRFVDGAQERRARMSKAADPGVVEFVTITNRATATLTVIRNVDSGTLQTITAADGWIIEDWDDMGPDHDLAYDSSFFVAVGGGTWGVDSADRERHSWHRIGYTLYYELHIVTSSITGTVSEIGALIPIASCGGASPVTGAAQRGLCYGYEAGVFTQMIWYTNAGDDRVRVLKSNGANFAAGANNMNLRLGASIELT